MPDDFAALAESNVRRIPEPIDTPEEPDIETRLKALIGPVAASSAVKDGLLPWLKRRIEELDEEESKDLGTPKQFETRGKRLFAKEMLAQWQRWSGQGSQPPGKGD